MLGLCEAIVLIWRLAVYLAQSCLGAQPLCINLLSWAALSLFFHDAVRFIRRILGLRNGTSLAAPIELPRPEEDQGQGALFISSYVPCSLLVVVCVSCVWLRGMPAVQHVTHVDFARSASLHP